MRRAKIVCTLGPATSDYDQILALVNAGMDVARLNLSHGDYVDHEIAYRNVRRAGDESGRGVGILADLQGPKIRLGTFPAGPVAVAPGDRFTITIDDVPGTASRCSTTYAGLPGDCSVGDPILVADGRIALRVTAVSATEVDTVVVEGGMLSDHKGINLPGIAVSVPALSEKDVADLRWALQLGVDLVALSFVRSASDFDRVREVMNEEGIRVPVLAKIEKPQAVEHLEEIIAAFDGIMVARGDLGVELPLEQVPVVQKRAVTLARAAGKPVIVATQMLDSMETANRPTRAEASDVANAVLDGADALMLSGETSVGAHPVLVVETMSRIIEYVEVESHHRLPALPAEPGGGTTRAVTRAAANVGDEIAAAYLVAFTETGRSARLMARHRSWIPLLAFTPQARVRSQLALVWGVETFLVDGVAHTDDMAVRVDATLLAAGRAKPGERVVLVGGVPPGVPGTTNGMRVHLMGSGPEGRGNAGRR
jgi:pyruvate kinase